MKKKILALAIGGVLSAGAQAALTDIVITEYTEGSGSDKAIELTNLGSDPFTFPAKIGVTKQSNGGTWYTVKDLDGTVIPAGGTLVIAHSSANKETLLKAIEDNGVTPILTSQMSHNGNDALALADLTDPKAPIIIDVLGTVDSDAYWGKDKTIRRRLVEGDSGDENPVQNTTYNAKEWMDLPKNTFDGLGKTELAPAPVTCSKQAQTTIAEIQGDSWSSPLIPDGKYVTDEDHFVTARVSAVTEYPKNGFYLYQSDGNNLTSDGLFVESPGAKADMVGQEVCVQSKVYEDYGMTQLEASSWEVTDATPQIVAAEDLQVAPEDGGSFDATLERYEGMYVKLPADMNPAEDGDQDMRVSRTFSFDYNFFRHNMVLSYKRPNMHPNQKFPAGSQDSKNQVTENNNYRLVVEGAMAYADDRDSEYDYYFNADGVKTVASDNIPYYAKFNADPVNNYVRVNDSVVGLEGVVVYHSAYKKPADFYLIAPNKDLPDLNFKHNTDRTTAKELAASLEKVKSGDIEIKIATQNVLNFFNSPFGGAVNEHGDNRGADSYAEYEHQKAKIVESIRGLDADIVGLMEIENNGFGDFGAIKELVDAVNEYYDEERPSREHYDNSTSNRYVFVGIDKNGDTIIDWEDSIGSDSITSGMLYRPTKVTLKSAQIIPMPAQHDEPVVNDNNVVVKNYKGEVLESGDNYQRDTLASTFIINQTGKTLTVSVNHLKSKGSTCVEDWDGVSFGTKEQLKFNEDKQMLNDTDFQGNCENFRVAAAVQLGREMDKIGGDRVIVGDMNSYAQEDPILVLTSNPTNKVIKAARNTFIGKEPQYGSNGAVVEETFGYLNAVAMKNPDGWSYSYEDAIGSLDHILISPTLKDRLVDADDWHINAAESPLYDYNTDRKGTSDDSENTFYAADAYRSSDHDSAIMVLSYTPGEAGEELVRLPVKSGLIDVPYNIPAKAAAKKGDIAHVTLSNADDKDLDMSKITLPNVALKSDGQSLVELEVFGVKSGIYNATMTLTRDGKVLPNSTVSMNVEVAKYDSLARPKVTVPEYDETGGSFGMFSIMSLLGLGFLRRKTK